MTDIMIIGEAWDKHDEEAGTPFAGPSGKLLYSLLRLVGINRDECYFTNVFNLRPMPTNDIGNLCGPKAEGIPGRPYILKGKYVKNDYSHELKRLSQEIETQSPNVIIALGATPAWALLDTSGIKAIRGAPVQSGSGYKVLPTYHPSAVLRDYKLKPIVMADLMKARRESTSPEVTRPVRHIWIEPTIADIKEFIDKHILPSPDLSIDIETKGDTITCIGFAPTKDIALVIPFFDPMVEGKNYWETKELEIEAWDLVRYLCGLDKKIVFQNGLYDMHFLWRTMGITVPHAAEDTMLLHHALQPEMEKGLGFLGTIYTDEASWKFMRKSDTIKKED